jgi:NADPH-dependent F420 reductase
MARIAFIGGTGPEGLGLAMRFAKSGNEIFIGSRDPERAREAAAKVKEKVPQARVQGLANAEAVEGATMVFVTVPFDAHKDTLEALAETIGDKVLVDVAAPMVFDRDGPRAIAVEEGSAAQQARAVARQAKVVSAFHHLDGTDLQKVERPMQGDVIVCGDHKGAKKRVLELVEEIEYVRALDGGGLTNSHYLEQWTVMLMQLNRIHRRHSGVRIVGI